VKLSELKPCAQCGGKITPIWYVVRISQAMIKPQSGNQVLGLMQILGGSLALAETMAPEADCVLVMGDQEPSLLTELHICQDCILMGHQNLALLMESASQSEQPKEGE